MNKNIEELFQLGQTQASISPDPHVWQRVDFLLNQKSKRNRFNFRIMSIAAIFLLLVTATVLQNRWMQRQYILEDLDTSSYSLANHRILDQISKSEFDKIRKESKDARIRVNQNHKRS